MEKDSARLFGTTVVITAAIIGGVYLLDRTQNSAAVNEAGEGGWTTLFSSSSPKANTSSSAPDTFSSPSSRNGQSPLPGSTSNPASIRHPGLDPGSTGENLPAEISLTDGIITCQHPEYGTVYANAANCDEVDYDNRLSRAEPFQPIPGRERYSSSDYQSPQNAAANSRRTGTRNKKQISECDKTSLRLHGRSPPKGLNVSCKFSVGKALEIERSLAVATDPAESIWLDSYCKWVNEAEKDECNVPSSTYCFIKHCPRWYPRRN